MTVCCVFVQGPYPYTPDYVYRLARMVAKFLPGPYRFVCLTDRPELLPGVETIRIAPTLGTPESTGYWTKLRLFDPAIGFSGRVLFLDLDVLVVGDLTPIVEYPAALATTQDVLAAERPRTGIDRFGRLVIRQINTSVLVWDAGEATDVFAQWTPDISRLISTDQDWLTICRPTVAAMPERWFPRLSRTSPPWSADAVVVLCKKPKNHEAVKKWPWFDAMWGGWAAA